MSPVHQVWPKPSRKAQWKGEEDKADRGRGGKTTSANGQAWSLLSPRGQWRTGNNGGNCLTGLNLYIWKLAMFPWSKCTGSHKQRCHPLLSGHFQFTLRTNYERSFSKCSSPFFLFKKNHLSTLKKNLQYFTWNENAMLGMDLSMCTDLHRFNLTLTAWLSEYVTLLSKRSHIDTLHEILTFTL